MVRVRYLAGVSTLLLSTAAHAEEAAAVTHSVEFMLGNVWVLLAAAMVFVMHLGFATIESGFSQSKNVVNVLFKNVSIIAIGLLTYYAIGFNLMYPGDQYAGGFFGFGGFLIGTDAAGVTAEYNEHYTYWTDFIFQAMFAATAATFVRVRLLSGLSFIRFSSSVRCWSALPTQSLGCGSGAVVSLTL